MINDAKVNVKELAKLLNVTQRRVQQLAKDGVIPKATRGEYPLLPCVEGYIAFLQETSKKIGGDNKDLMATRLRYENARADMAELELSEKMGEIIKQDDIKDIITVMLSNFSAKMLALPSAIASQGTGLPQAELLELAKNKVHEALNELSGYDSEQAESPSGN